MFDVDSLFVERIALRPELTRLFHHDAAFHAGVIRAAHLMRTMEQPAERAGITAHQFRMMLTDTVDAILTDAAADGRHRVQTMVLSQIDAYDLSPTTTGDTTP